MGIRKRKGFTLVELVVVLAILGIVGGAIATVFQYASRSYAAAGQRTEVQFETRMAMDKVKRELGVAKSVVISDIIPATLPATGGYCYYDVSAHCLKLRDLDGNTYDLIATLPDSTAVSAFFTPVEVNGVLSTVALNWTVDGYLLSTEVFIQNREAWKGSITTTYDISSTAPPGIYIEFS